MSYKTSKVAKFLDAHCSRCGRSIVDAVSVEKGQGPVCRSRGKVKDDLPVSADQLQEGLKDLANVGDESLRLQVLKGLRDSGSGEAVNKLVHYIATNRGSQKAVRSLKVIEDFGYTNVARKIEENLPHVQITL